MRILHTSDWHIGKPIKNRSRLDEYAAVLEEIVGIAEQEKVDLVLVAGDIFDSKNPPAEAEQLVYETLLRLHGAGIRVVLVAGNHDHAGRLEAVRGLLGVLDVSVVCRVNKQTAGEAVRVPSRDGTQEALVAALPFVSERYLLTSEDLMSEAGARYSRYSDGMKVLLQRMETLYDPKSFNILSGHFMVSGAKVGGAGEQELTIGLTYAVEPAALPNAGAQYLALGHVHRPQEIPGHLLPGSYSGSLLQLDFGEVGQGKSVVIVEGEAGALARTRTIPLARGRRLVDVADTVSGLEARRAEFGDAWLRIFVQLDAPLPGVNDIMRGLFDNVVQVIAQYPALGEPTPAPAGAEKLTAEQQFAEYYRRQRKAEPTSQLMAAFEEVRNEVDLEERISAASTP